MSLINQMLQDLERRRAPEAEPLAGIATAGGRRRSALRLPVAAALVLAAGWIAGAWLHGTGRTEPQPAAAPATVPVAASPVPPAAVAVQLTTGPADTQTATAPAATVPPVAPLPAPAGPAEPVAVAPEPSGPVSPAAPADPPVAPPAGPLGRSLRVAELLPPAPPVRLTAIGLEASGGGTRLGLELSGPVAYRAYVRAEPASLTVELPGVEAPADLGQPGDSDLVYALAQDRRDGVLVLSFALAAPVRLEASRLLAAAGTHRLELSLMPGAGPAAPAVVDAPPPRRQRPQPARVGPAEQADREYREALRLIEAGAGQQAQPHLLAALAADPGHLPARELLVARLLEQGRVEQAEELLAQGQGLAPREPGLVKLRARLLAERGDATGALALLDPDLADPATDPELHALRAALLRRAGDPAGAARVYAELVRLRPAAAVWWLGLGLALEESGQGQAALSAYRTSAGRPDLSPALRRFVAGRVQALTGDPLVAGG